MRIPSRKVLAAALGIGIAGDVLLRGGEWRLGFALWIAALVVSVFFVGGRPGVERTLLLGGIALAAFGQVWNDAPMLFTIDLMSVLCMGALTIWHGTGRRISELTVIESVRAGILGLANTLGGAADVLATLRGQERGTATGTGRSRALLIGAALALPPLFLVTVLLAASDAVFGRVLERLIAPEGLGHVIVALLLAWMATGWLRSALGDSLGKAALVVRSPGLPFLSIAVGLYALIAVLLLFVATQARVLFGGAAFLREAEGLTVANYAREGFFQLILASVIVLGTLVLAEWLLAEDDAASRPRYRVAGSVLVTLVLALLVSSATRIWLYVSEFGLSVDRAFASAAIVGVLAVMIVLAGTTLRGQPAKFAPLTLLCTIGWVMVLNLINPEARIVNVNMSRAVQGSAFDVTYHASLSADAVPALLRGAPRLPAADCEKLVSAMRESWRLRFKQEGTGNRWRQWNLPRAGLVARLERGATCAAAVSR